MASVSGPCVIGLRVALRCVIATIPTRHQAVSHCVSTHAAAAVSSRELLCAAAVDPRQKSYLVHCRHCLPAYRSQTDRMILQTGVEGLQE